MPKHHHSIYTRKPFLQGTKYQGDRDLASLEIYLRESLGMEIEDKKVEDVDEKFQIEDGVYMLSNSSFSQVSSNP